MKKCYFHIVVCCLLATCGTQPAEDPPASAGIRVQSIDTLALPESVRAIQGLSNTTAWFAGAGGLYGYTTDGGKTWTLDSLEFEDQKPHFRSIAITEEAVHLLSIASPALLFRSEDRGQSWELVYREDHPQVFYDAMAFWDDRFGLAMGDPTGDCLSVIRTIDGGQSWEKVPCPQIPPAAEGEAAFAASNTNLSLGSGGRAWMVSGGAKARVYRTEDRGQSWTVADSPIAAGGQMTGIYSIDMYADTLGILFGGDWNRKDQNRQNKALSTDGGFHWQLLSDGGGPGYRSCVRFVPDTEGMGILAVGSPGISYSPDRGAQWTELDIRDFYSFDFGDDGRVVWLAGQGKVGRMELSYGKN